MWILAVTDMMLSDKLLDYGMKVLEINLMELVEALYVNE